MNEETMAGSGAQPLEYFISVPMRVNETLVVI